MISQRWILLGLLAALTLLGACSADQGEAQKEVAAAAQGHEDHKDGEKGEEGHADEPDSGHADEHAEGEEGHEDEEASPLTLSAEQLDAAGVRFETLAPMTLGEELRAPGEVLENAYGTTLITPSIPGLVVKRHARLGDEVKAGTLLVTLSSVEVAQAQGELQLAEQEWKRVSALGEEAVSGRRYSEARISVEQARAKARAYGIGGSGGAGGQFSLSAPHDGRITEDAFTVGERVEPGHTLFRLVDESIVWVDAKLTPDNAHRIEVGSEATVVAGDARLPGKVTLRAHRTAEATRNAIVRIEVANTDDRLHAGDYVDALLKASGTEVQQLAAPTAALVQLEGKTVVFRRSADGVEPVEVQVGSIVGERTEITAGIVAGDSIAVSGAFTLKSRQLKSQMGEGHAH
ncbi:MAG: efflux RND transporter periplasmic adaptor subunit [Rhodanobacteraceae bacterium]|nr:efflux RND transporter periplasmic adaptor subunit [Rhodanobacteraceae bacterium]